MIYFIISLALTMIRLDHFVKDDFASLLNALTPFGFQSLFKNRFYSCFQNEQTFAFKSV